MQVYIVQSKTNLIIMAILMIIIGALFVINKNLALDIGFIVAGVMLIIIGLFPMIQMKDMNIIGIIFILLGLILIIFPYVFTDITQILLGIIAIVVGAVGVFNSMKEKNQTIMILGVLVGVLILVAGVTMVMKWDIAFQIFGILLIIGGVLDLVAISKAN